MLPRMHPSDHHKDHLGNLGIHLIRVAHLLPGEASKKGQLSAKKNFKYLRCPQAFFPVESNMFHHCFCGQATLLDRPQTSKKWRKNIKINTVPFGWWHLTSVYFRPKPMLSLSSVAVKIATCCMVTNIETRRRRGHDASTSSESKSPRKLTAKFQGCCRDDLKLQRPDYSQFEGYNFYVYPMSPCAKKTYIQWWILWGDLLG